MYTFDALHRAPVMFFCASAEAIAWIVVKTSVRLSGGFDGSMSAKSSASLSALLSSSFGRTCSTPECVLARMEFANKFSLSIWRVDFVDVTLVS